MQAGAEQDRSSTHTSTVDSRAGGRKDSFERLARKRMHELLGRRRHDQERPDGRGHRSSQHTPGRSDTKRADRRQGGDNSNADGLSGAPSRGGGRSPTQQPASLASPLPRGAPGRVRLSTPPPPRALPDAPSVPLREHARTAGYPNAASPTHPLAPRIPATASQISATPARGGRRGRSAACEWSTTAATRVRGTKRAAAASPSSS